MLFMSTKFAEAITVANASITGSELSKCTHVKCMLNEETLFFIRII